MRDRLRISPHHYAIVALVALAALTLIVLTGAAVRLTGSGLGCPDWPKCYGGTVPPLDTHAVIEYGNRLLTGFVGIAVIAASALAWFRQPFRGHLALGRDRVPGRGQLEQARELREAEAHAPRHQLQRRLALAD